MRWRLPVQNLIGRIRKDKRALVLPGIFGIAALVSRMGDPVASAAGGSCCPPPRLPIDSAAGPGNSSVALSASASSGPGSPGPGFPGPVSAGYASTGTIFPAAIVMAPTPGPVDGYISVGFEQLGNFPMEWAAGTPLTPERAVSLDAQIPKPIRALDGEKVLVSGFMLPTRYEKGLAVEFLLMRSQLTCCYGIVPQPNEWIVVRMPGSGITPTMDVPVSFFGRFHVGAHCENTLLEGIYYLDGERMADARS